MLAASAAAKRAVADKAASMIQSREARGGGYGEDGDGTWGYGGASSSSAAAAAAAAAADAAAAMATPPVPFHEDCTVTVGVDDMLDSWWGGANGACLDPWPRKA